jgi:hypothetical protein
MDQYFVDLTPEGESCLYQGVPTLSFLVLYQEEATHLQQLLRTLAALAEGYSYEIVLQHGWTGPSVAPIVTHARETGVPLRYFPSPPIRIPGRGFNQLLARARGELFLCVEPGVQFWPGALTPYVRALQAGADLVYGDLRLVTGGELGETRLRPDPSDPYGLFPPLSSFLSHRRLYDQGVRFSELAPVSPQISWIRRAVHQGARLAHLPCPLLRSLGPLRAREGHYRPPVWQPHLFAQSAF